MRGWGKGVIWVNGRNLGRYWYIGPQQTLYLPGVWLRKGTNNIAVLEMEDHTARTVRGLRDPILDQQNPDKLAPQPPQRLKGTPALETTDLANEEELATGDSVHTERFTPRACRYVCLDALSAQDADDPYTSLAELNLLDDKGATISRAKWKIPYVDSEELDSEDGRAENMLDGDIGTFWHTEWGNAQPKHPHAVIIDLGEVKTIGGIRFSPRSDGSHGWIKSYRLYLRQSAFEMK
jgi:beta-galactosidase